MRMRLLLVAAGSVAGLALLAAARAEPARATEAGTPPAATQPATAPAPGVTFQEVKKLLKESNPWAKWGVVLSALSLAGVLWLGYSLRTLAKNQVALEQLIRAARPPQE